MTVNVTKSSFNVREKLKELERPIGLKGSELMRAETAQDARDLVSAGRKNFIINGDMRIDQRNNGSSINTPNVGLAVDRWKCATYVSGTTIQRSTTAPPGFTNSYLMTNGTAVAPFASTYYQQIWQHIEGYNIAHLAWGTSNAKPISISFWVRSSASGLYSFGLGNGTNPAGIDHTRSFCQTFTIDSANTWEYKTFTIPGCPSGTWATGNTHGITIAFNLGSGTAYDTNSPGLWSSSSTYMHNSTSSTIEFNNITGATFYLTGVQMEVGKNATEFEHRSYGEELALCQRYFLKLGGESKIIGMGSGTTISTTQGWGVVQFPVTMRVPPTAALLGGTGVTLSNGTVYPSSPTLGTQYAGVTGTMLTFGYSAGTYAAANQGTVLYTQSGATDGLTFNAEL